MPIKYERAILISFLGNYLINNIVAAIVALLGLSGNTAVQYSVYIALASIAVVLFTWWYLKPLSKDNGVMDGAIFGVIAFVVAVVTAFVSGISGVITQTGSLSQVLTVLPNFWPFLANWSTLALLGYWVIPGAGIGYFLQMKSGAKSSSMV
jgi:hypothetical protein